MDPGPLSFTALVAGTLTRWRSVLGVAAVTVALAVVLSLVLPPSYRATASFVTTDPAVDMPSRMADLALEPGLSGLAQQFGLSSSRDPSQSPAFYTQLLLSRELLTRLAVSRFPDPRAAAGGDSAPLVQLLGVRSRDTSSAVELAVRRLRRRMFVTFDPKTNLVTLRLDTRWPALSAAVANEAVALVSAFNREQRLSRARARREFLEGRVASALAELRAVEDSQRLFYERNRLWESSPALLVDERRLRRGVETVGSLYLSLRQQQEAARLDEVNTTPVITVVDRAVPPRRRQWPRRTLIVSAAALLGGMLGLLAGGAREVAAHWARRNPDEAGLLRGVLRRVGAEVRGTVSRRAPAGGDGARR